VGPLIRRRGGGGGGGGGGERSHSGFSIGVYWKKKTPNPKKFDSLQRMVENSILC